MKTSKIMSIVAVLVVCAIFQIIVFVIPSDFSASFWISYAFSMITFIVILTLICVTDKLKNINKGILPYTLAFSTGVYAITEFIIFLLSKFINNLPTWLSILLNIIVLGLYILIFISIYAFSNRSNKLRSDISKKVFYIKDLQVDVDVLVSQEKDKDIKEKLIQLSEKIKYSDPMSNENLQFLELNIKDKVNELKKSTDKEPLIDELLLLLEERNQKVKILKRRD